MAAGCGSDRAWRPVEFPGGAEYRPSLLEASQLQLSQGPHTRPLPVEAGVEEGLAGVFLLPTIPNIANKTSAPWIHQKELIVEDTGLGYHEGSCWNFGIYHHQCAGEISRRRYLQINI